MTALATTDDVAAALERMLTTAEVAAAAKLILLASAAVEEQTGRLFAPGTYVTTGRVGPNGRLRLPATVASATSVGVVDSADATLTNLAADTYTLRNSTLYGLGRYCGREIETTFVVTADIPDDIVALVAGIVAGRIAQPAAGITSELIGPNQVTFGNNSGRIYFSASDKMILRRYRVPASAIRLV